ncbi:HlyC/CorC family transporter [Brachybacterium sp. Marseille-Q2903]|uniref:HlyC/CorC family transporter n=1 Tax=Brachybacterium epidermidis TaxID=2781983 RepID=A0ABR9VZI5_9MICO|nr:hemolysin family protein [Brachybacterium epidermidis]MBE9403135.1 HlyC/CorC family transporter [Brachybacterium epidermidis]
MGTTILLLLLGVAIILALIAANGYFVAQEFAYMSVDRSRLRAAAAGGDEAAKRAVKVTERTSFMLSGAQLGITVTGLLVGYVAEPLVGESLGTILGVAGVPAAISIAAGTVLALVLATVAQMIFGELYPKNLAIAAPEPVARAVSRSTLIYLALFGWLITVFDHAANGLIRLLGMEPVHDVDSTATAKDLERIVRDSRDSGDMPEDLSVVIDRVIDFPEQDAEHAMVPRAKVSTVDTETTIGEIRTLMAGAHSRYPVVSDEDEPVGVVLMTDLLAAGHGDHESVTVAMREPLIVPERMPLPDVLEALSEVGQEIACVIDEFGTFSGILTEEDLAEELIGELHDEHDAETDEVTASTGPEDSWEMDGDVHADELIRLIGHPLPEDDYETVGGLVIAQLGELPEEGRTLTIELPAVPSDVVADQPVRRELHIEVLETDRHVPSRLRVELRVHEIDPDELKAGDIDSTDRATDQETKR